MTDPSRPHLLLTNDDGIEAVGLRALADALRPHADLTIVAPASERSGTGHAITVFSDLHFEPRHRDGQVWGWGLNGTPADCVKVAVTFLGRDRPFDLVISGINYGQNAGVNILYSGTVAAAREATMLGLPAIAISQYFRDPEDLPYATAARVGVDMLQMMRGRALPRGIMLNVNVPPVAYEALRGWSVTRMGNSGYIDHFQPQSPEGALPAIYRNIGKGWNPTSLEGEDFDDHALVVDRVSITPLHFDLTAGSFLGELTDWVSALK